MKKVTLNSNQLKLIAIIAMTIDHLADIIYPGFQPRSFHYYACYW